MRRTLQVFVAAVDAAIVLGPAEPLGAADPKPPQVRHFDAKNLEQAKQWQLECRAGLIEGLELSDFIKERTAASAGGEPGVPLNAEITGQEDIGHSSLFRMTLDITPDWTMEAFLTVPKEGERFPAVVCVHGGKEHVYPQTKSCIWPGADRMVAAGWKGFGAAPAERGYMTIAADFQIPGAKVRDRTGTNWAERVEVGMRLIDYLYTRGDVDTGRIGCIGICKWGAAACHLAAVDPRIKAAVSSSTLIRDAEKVPFRHAGPDQPPFDLLDIYSLIAPRPILCQFGETDSFRPQYPTAAELDEMRRRYGVLGGRPDDLEVFWHPGGHVVETSSLPGFFDRAFRQSDEKGQKGTP